MPQPSDWLTGSPERAAGYAAHRPRYPQEVADFLAGVSPGRDLAWDAGCGSGQLSVLLGDRFDRVVATDLSAEQIAKAEPHPRVEYRSAPADASGLAAGTVQLATAAQAAHWFELDAYYAEVRRVACPGAVVALVTYGVMTVDDDVDAVMRPFYRETLATHWAPERRHVEDGYRSLPFPFREIEAPQLELRASWTLTQMLGYVGTWSAVHDLERSGGGAAIAEFQAELTRVWGEPETVRAVRWPISMRVGQR